MKNMLLEIFYVLAGLVSIAAAIYALKDKKHPAPQGTAAFWGIFGLIFIIGKYLPPALVGFLILVMGALTAMNKVTFGSLKNSDEASRKESANKLGNKLFMPALTIGVVAFAVAQALPKLGGLVGLGFGSVLATLYCLGITKSAPSNLTYDGSRLLLQVGAACILPQLLTALGSLFKAAGVGEVIASGIGGIIPEGNILAGVIAYCVGMALFTMIMGNAFAAFAVITAGIGMPFVFSQGANPAIAGILGLTAGYCGTLMTPMAANFNIVPAAVLDTKNKNRVIISQVPFALALFVTHIILMYIWAF
ncbi:DUF979 domain-containing protein [Paramaledivibacter caminithermalis]|uniref:Uncharacterized membrane protein n=1 Tax=Paramaledivibacter caminithermalis (strain DSM 15212 / CIP 107654 / DViRD3) TaxID=1121301 RepID=A0A1M6LGW0_PARC5|nr:DUF979 domain-containing protein [Paramaledivibacter caminithermalis]SHJ70355.1 Uncharacterized membrane protein [Paramaledivibacter caminithermalis DSM 15212]